jgi:hypothetical protein
MSRLQQRYSGMGWHDLVVAKIKELRQRNDDDAEMFETIYSRLDDAKSARDGEKLERLDKQSATLSYKGTHVLSFSVDSGTVFVDDGQNESPFPSADAAIEHMATMMAAAVERNRTA